MAEWLNIDAASNEVSGWQSSPNAVPADTAAQLHIETTAANGLRAQWDTLRQQMAAEGRVGRVVWDGTAIVLPPDLRPYFEIISNKAEISADGVDTATVTVRKLNADDTLDSTFSATLTLATESGRMWRLIFVAGEAVKQFKTTVSGTFDVDSTPSFRLRAPFSLLAYE